MYYLAIYREKSADSWVKGLGNASQKVKFKLAFYRINSILILRAAGARVGEFLWEGQRERRRRAHRCCGLWLGLRVGTGGRGGEHGSA